MAKLTTAIKSFVWRLNHGGLIWFTYECVPSEIESSTHTIVMANPSLSEIKKEVLALQKQVETLQETLIEHNHDVLAKLDEIIGDTNPPSQPDKFDIKVTKQV